METKTEFKREELGSNVGDGYSGEIVDNINTDPVVHMLSMCIETLPADKKAELIKIKGFIEQIDGINNLYKKLTYVATKLPPTQQGAILENIAEQCESLIPLDELYIGQPRPIDTAIW